MNESDSQSLRKKKWMAMLDNIKKRSNNVMDVPVIEDIKHVRLNHGLSLISTKKLLGEYLNICYCSDVQEYFVLDDDKKVYRYSMQGKLILPSIVLTSSMVFTRIIWCADVKILSCFAVDSDLLWILTPQFKFITIIKNEFIVKNLFFSPDTNELFVIGATNMTKYLMRDLDKTLESYDTINFYDDYYTSNWMIQQSSLIRCDSSSPKIVGSFLTTIYIFSTIHDKNGESHEPGKFIARKLGASPALITALHFESMSQWIIIGDQLGNVVGWSLSLECTLECLDGHKGAVRMIISHPSICGFVTSAEDNVLQIWSCNFREKMESFTDLGAISSMAINPSAFSIATLGLKLNFFYMQQLYTFFSPLTAPVTILLSTMTPMHPTRVIVQTSDNNVNILSSVGGRQLNIAMLPPNETPISMAYSEITKSIYIIVADSRKIMVYTIETRPMEIRKVWKNYVTLMSCIVVYDFYDESYRCTERTQHESKFTRPVRVCIIVGTATGEIASIDETTGKYIETVTAHNGGVKKLYVSGMARHILSIGEDYCVKLWRILPTIVFPLALIDAIYHSNPITNVASMGSTICFVSNSNYSLSHQLLMYEAKEKIKLEHHPSKDHSGDILGVATSEFLLICATFAEDKTIRVWDKHNHLIKILNVNIWTRELTFSSLRGDIVFGAGKHLYRLPYKNYLPAKYKTEILSNNIPEDKDERLVFKHDKYKECERDEDKMKSLHLVSSILLGSLDPSAETPCLELILQQHISMQLKFRDEDIIKIRDKMIRTIRTVKKRALMNYEEWKEYVNELIGICSRKDNNITSVLDVWKNLEDYKSIKKSYKSSLRKKNKYNECSVGFVPNSLIVVTSTKQNAPSASITSPKAEKFKYVYPDEITQFNQYQK